MIHPKKKICPCVCVRLILVLVLGRQTVYGQKTVYLCSSTYIVFENTHAEQRACDNCGQRNGGRSCCLMDRVVDRVVRVTTAASETEGVAAVSWIESLMTRRPLGSIDPNSIRETELHTESRRRQPWGEGVPTQPAASQGEGCCSSEACRYA